MKEHRNSDEYSGNAKGRDQEERIKTRLENKPEHVMAINPNPAANENIKGKNISTNENRSASQAGSEITDGEDG